MITYFRWKYQLSKNLKNVEFSLFSYSKSDFIYTVATQGDTGDIWSEQKSKVSDILVEQQKWIQGLEKRKERIQEYLGKITIGK